MESMEKPIVTSTSARRDGTFGLRFIFLLVIGCSLFFTLFSVWPPLAIAAAMILTPAIIRTGNIENQYRLQFLDFGWRERGRFFAQSLGMMLNTVLIASAVFVATCFFCAVCGYAFGAVFSSSVTSPKDVAFVGATGGALWGVLASLVAIAWYWNRSWLPNINYRGEDLGKK